MATPQTRTAQVQDLVNQWEQLIGYSIAVPDADIAEMATHPDQISTLWDIGQYMDRHKHGSGPGIAGVEFVPGWYDTMPWAKYGLSAQEYQSRYEGFDSVFRNLTGQAVQQGLVEAALKEHAGSMTASQFQTWLMGLSNFTNTYGWVKYGLDFQQFQQHKTEMRQQFGFQMSDADAVAQLQYHHQAQGANMGVGVQPTLTQQEKKTTQQGVSGNVVR